MYYLKSRDGYWLPKGMGYTKVKGDAGQFSFEDMRQLNLDGVTLYLVNPNDVNPKEPSLSNALKNKGFA